jgi:SAM-dependent methyltransferase
MTDSAAEPDFQLAFQPVERCPLCRSVEKTVRVQPPFPGGGGRAVFVACSGCGLIYLDPAPDADSLTRFYSSVYLTPEYRKVEGFAATDPRVELLDSLKYSEFLADEVEKVRMPRGRLLDVGCSYGGFLIEMQLRGWDVMGIEPFSDAVTFCKERLGLNVLCGDIDNGMLPEGAFDVVTLWEVIEHFASPVAAMRRLTHLAAPDSILMLTTPNPNSPAALFAREDWIGWKPPTHLCLFDFNTIRILLERTGWTVRTVHACGVYPGQLFMIAERKRDAGTV